MLGAAVVDGAGAVADDDVANTERQQELGNRHARRAAAVYRNVQVLQRGAAQLGGVEQCRADDDGGAVLIVMEDGHIELETEPALDLEAARRGDIFQIYAAEARGDGADVGHDIIRLASGEADGKGFDPGQRAEEDGLAFHHR